MSRRHPASLAACFLVLTLLAIAACRREAAVPNAGPAGHAAASASAPKPLLEDVVEHDPRYVIGISYPPIANRYPGLAARVARAELSGRLSP